MRKLIVLLSFVFFSGAAMAEPAKAETVRELLKLSKVERMLDMVYGNLDQTMENLIQTGLKGQAMSEEDKKKTDQFRSKFIQIMKEELSWEKLEPLYTKIYQDVFTQEEMESLVAFYKTPGGQALIEKMPLTMQKSMSVMQERLPGLMVKIEALTKETFGEAPASGKKKKK
ncbi:DUF2059 domain-containing protein [Massilia sp. W12]|uniref:DUF2059 domain-containing protein n=1 Tax=Massilia sp. W12 TaxID=3126507 RepID=UPI0030D39E29